MQGNNSDPLWRLILNILIDCQMAEEQLVRRLGSKGLCKIEPPNKQASS